MRVSASSSFLIATLAISTSSPCLGAPTVDQQGDRLSSFNSVRDLSARVGGEVTATGPPKGHLEFENKKLFSARELQRRGLLKSLLGGLPLIGPLVAGVDDTLCGGTSAQAFGAESFEDSGPTEEQMVQMMEAAYTLSSVFDSATKATPLASSTTNTASTVTSTPTPTMTETSTEIASTESAMATPMSAESDSDSRILVAPDSLPASSTATITSTSTLATETATESSVSTSTSTTPASTVVAQDAMPTPPSQVPNTPVGFNGKVPVAPPNAPVSPPGVPAAPPNVPKVPVNSSQPPVDSPVANLPANAPNPSLNAPVDAQPPVSLPDGAQRPNAPIHPELPKTPANGPVAQAPIS